MAARGRAEVGEVVMVQRREEGLEMILPGKGILVMIKDTIDLTKTNQEARKVFEEKVIIRNLVLSALAVQDS